jgi:hypothetical protein
VIVIFRKPRRFNSSGATIIPDPISRARASVNANQVAGISNARLLMPQDTLGRELEGLVGGGWAVS